MFVYYDAVTASRTGEVRVGLFICCSLSALGQEHVQPECRSAQPAQQLILVHPAGIPTAAAVV